MHYSVFRTTTKRRWQDSIGIFHMASKWSMGSNSLYDYKRVKNHLDDGQQFDNELYAMGSGGHSVVVIKNDADGLYYFRDSNILGITISALSVNLEFSDQLFLRVIFLDR